MWLNVNDILVRMGRPAVLWKFSRMTSTTQIVEVNESVSVSVVIMSTLTLNISGVAYGYNSNVFDL